MAERVKTPDLDALLEFVKDTRGFDFTGYKRSSIQRRVAKRMAEVGVDRFEDYIDYLQLHGEEFAQLFNTLLINVTAFFRDGPAWDFLRSTVIPRVIEESQGNDSIRIWSTGCASGEEAYSLAIAFAEVLPDADFRERVKIYATDVDEEALQEGRHGIYLASKLETVPLDLREKYFDRVEQRFVVKPEVRRSVIFGRHDVVQDPPISRIDLLSSRNTLMYFTADAQSRILANFHFALRNGGFLFLGKSEMMLTRSQLFVPVNLKQRVFEKVARADAYRTVPRPPVPGEHEPVDTMRDVGFETAPIAQVVVDTRGNVTLANQQARTLFGLAQRDVGRPLKDLELSYKPVELRSQIEKAYAERHSISLRDVEWLQPGGDLRVFDVQVGPLVAQDGAFVGVGVSFLDVTRYKRLQDAVEHSKRDVETAYEELQSTVEELETTNEELQSTNEELETTNEELQSTNEELETMNEELQSTNEELETINDELNQRTDELNQTNLFMASILRSLEAAVIVLDDELRVAAWNDGAFELWGLRAEETQNQHFMNLDIGFPTHRLRPGLRAVLNGEEPPEHLVVESTNRRGRQLDVRVQLSPLADNGGAPRGVIVFMEAVED
jgi:two-component system CheB/CheR fusion protein